VGESNAPIEREEKFPWRDGLLRGGIEKNPKAKKQSKKKGFPGRAISSKDCHGTAKEQPLAQINTGKRNCCGF